MKKKWPTWTVWVVFLAFCAFAILEVVLFHVEWLGGLTFAEAPADAEALKTVLAFNTWQTGLVLGLFAAFSFLVGQRSVTPTAFGFLLESLTLLFLGFAILFAIILFYEVEYMLTSNAVDADYEHFTHARVAQMVFFGAGLVLFGLHVVVQQNARRQG